MMNVAYRCPACQTTARATFSAESKHLDCPKCHQQIAIPEGAVSGNRIERCLVCPSTDLFARKDFPQRLGVALVILGFGASCITWAHYQVFWTFAILFLTAFVDLVLYVVMGESLTCYRCDAQYRGSADIARHGGFDLETHERYRQLAARLKERPVPPTAPNG
jgi:DNA-directed RNA polymerase subunit RPC12/RpoP